MALEIEAPAVLTAGQVAELMGVDPKTVTRWAIAGKIGSFKTLGGHRRYLRSEVEARMTGSWTEPRVDGES